MKTKTRKNLLKMLGVCFAGAVALSLSAVTGNVTASAETPDKTTGFYMEDGASVAKTDTVTAISWKTTLSAGYYEYLTTTYAKVDFGTLIAPNATCKDLEDDTTGWEVLDQEWLGEVTGAGTYRVSMVYWADAENTELTDEQKNKAYDMALTALSYVECYTNAEDTTPATTIFADYTGKDTTRSARGVAYQHLVEKNEALEYIGSAQTNATVEKTQYLDVNYNYQTETSLNGYVNTGLTGFTDESDVWEDYSVYYGSKKITTGYKATLTEQEKEAQKDIPDNYAWTHKDGVLYIAGFSDLVVSYTHTRGTLTQKHGDGEEETITLIAKNGDYLQIPLKPVTRIFMNENFTNTEWETWFSARTTSDVIKGYYILGETITANNKFINTTGWKTEAGQTVTAWNKANTVTHEFIFDGLYHTLATEVACYGLFGNINAPGANTKPKICNVKFDIAVKRETGGSFALGNRVAGEHLQNVIISMRVSSKSTGDTRGLCVANTGLYSTWTRWNNVVIESEKDETGAFVDYSTYSSNKNVLTTSTNNVNFNSNSKGIYVLCHTNTGLVGASALGANMTSARINKYSDYATVSAVSAFANTFAYDATKNTVVFK